MVHIALDKIQSKTLITKKIIFFKKVDSIERQIHPVH